MEGKSSRRSLPRWYVTISFSELARAEGVDFACHVAVAPHDGSCIAFQFPAFTLDSRVRSMKP